MEGTNATQAINHIWEQILKKRGDLSKQKKSAINEYLKGINKAEIDFTDVEYLAKKELVSKISTVFGEDSSQYTGEFDSEAETSLGKEERGAKKKEANELQKQLEIEQGIRNPAGKKLKESDSLIKQIAGDIERMAKAKVEILQQKQKQAGYNQEAEDQKQQEYKEHLNLLKDRHDKVMEELEKLKTLHAGGKDQRDQIEKSLKNAEDQRKLIEDAIKALNSQVGTATSAIQAFQSTIKTVTDKIEESFNNETRFNELIETNNQHLENIGGETKQIRKLIEQALGTQPGQDLVKLPIIRSAMPELASNVIANRKFTLSEEGMRQFEEIMAKVMKSGDPSAQYKVGRFSDQVHKEYKHSEGGELSDFQSPRGSEYNGSTSGIPQIRQKIAQPISNKNSANGTVAINGSGFAGQKVEPAPEEIYNAVTGQVHVTQYKSQKEKFLKETFHKVRNLHPEVKVQAEKVLRELARHYQDQIAMNDEKYKEVYAPLAIKLDKVADEGKKIKEVITKMEQKLKTLKEESKIQELKEQIQEKQNEFNQKRNEHREIQLKIEEIKQQVGMYALENPHVAANERRAPQYPVFAQTDAQREIQIDTGIREAEEIKVQNQPMVSNLERGSNNNPGAHSQNQEAQRDPGEVYNHAIEPNYDDTLPYLTSIAKILERENQSDNQQSQLDLALLYEKDPFKLLHAIEFLKTQYANVPLTTKEQQRVRNEAEAIARKIGRDQVFYPYNEKEIRLLQGSMSKYYDANGGVVHQPALKKSYYETIQKAEQAGIRKELQHLHGVNESDKVQNLRKAQLEALEKKELQASIGKFLTAQQRKEQAKNKKLLKEGKQPFFGAEPDEDNQPLIQDEKGEMSVKDLVQFVHQLVKYTSKINGNINLDDVNLESYKSKTTTFTPLIAKKETNNFTFTASSAFKLRPC